MLCPWRELLVLAAALTFTSTAAAQHIRELGVQAIGTFSDPGLAAASLYAALRTPGRTRISLSFGAGTSAGKLALRGEVLGHFLLSPEERRGPGFYLAGGVAGVEGPVDRGYLVLTLGVEQRPGVSQDGISSWGLGVVFGLLWATAGAGSPELSGNKNAPESTSGAFSQLL
jgi:hypothetical protein